MMLFITGATGLVGRFIAKDLLDKEISFTALKRETSIIPEVLTQHENYSLINWENGNLADVVDLADILKEVDVIIHSAAVISFYSRDYDQMLETNVGGTANLVDLAIQKGVSRFIYISSIAALGRSSKEAFISEDSKWYKSKNNSYYAETKHLAELEVWRGIEEGLPAVILNPSTVLGPSDWDTSSTRIFKFVWNEARYYATGSLNYVDVRDVADIVLKMLELEVTGERYILNGGKIELKDLFQKIAAHFRKRAPQHEVNPWIIGIVAFLEGLRARITGGKPIITPETVRLSRLNNTFDNHKIKSLLNFEFKTLENTLVWTCDELKRMITSND